MYDVDVAFIINSTHQHIKLNIMAKAAKTAIKTKDQKAAAEAKNWTKVIKAVRSPKTGAYTFKEADRAQRQGERFPGAEII